MAITQDELKQEGDDYAAAFNEDPQPAAEQSEDAAFGLDVEAATGGDSEGEAPAVNEGEAAEGEAPVAAKVPVKVDLTPKPVDGSVAVTEGSGSKRLEVGSEDELKELGLKDDDKDDGDEQPVVV